MRLPCPALQVQVYPARLVATVLLLPAVFSLATALAQAKLPAPKPQPDVIVFTNGDQLSGTLERGTGNSIYLIGGLGTYDTGSHWDTGFNLGGGFRFPLTGFSAYIEARYHSVAGGDLKFVPVVFGLAF